MLTRPHPPPPPTPELQKGLRCPFAKENASFSSQFNPNFLSRTDILQKRTIGSPCFTCICRENLRARCCSFQLSQISLGREERKIFMFTSRNSRWHPTKEVSSTKIVLCKNLLETNSNLKYCKDQIKEISDTVEPPFATTSRKRPPLISDHFSKIPKIFKSNHYRWNLS